MRFVKLRFQMAAIAIAILCLQYVLIQRFSVNVPLTAKN